MTLPFTKEARARKEAKAVLTAARVYCLSWEDVKDVSALDAAWRARDVARCREILADWDAPKSCAAAREWLDILVVSISVAMCFRAYYYEPFNIPTGSMQPTLYGNYTVEAKPAEKTVWDLPVLSLAKFALTGETYKEFRAPWDGTLVASGREDGCFDLRVASALHAPGLLANPLPRWLGGLLAENEIDNLTGLARIPNDAIRGTGGDAPEAAAQGRPRLATGFAPGDRVKKGDLIWCGRVKKGDFLFVNRWLWNFRAPRRGDVMIFNTTGIPGLAQGTHYIKRMTGTPGETLTIKDGHLYADGARPMAPRRIAQIQNREKGEPHMYPYAGYRPTGDGRFAVTGRTIMAEGDEVRLGADEYFACGDNSPSSYDSRYWGPVPAAKLCGIAGGVFWPIVNPRWGVVE